MDCNRVQENIAWGRDLQDADKRHALGCAACLRVLEDFTVLQSALEEHLDGVRVPEGFADRVMKQVRERVRQEGRRPALSSLRELGLTIHFRLAYVWGVILLAFGLLAPSAI